MKLLIVAVGAALGAALYGAVGALVGAGLAGGIVAIFGHESADEKIKRMRRELGYDDTESDDSDEDSEVTKSELLDLDLIADTLDVPVEVFALNITLEGTLSTRTTEELAVLKFRVANFARNERLEEYKPALRKFLERLEPLVPKDAEQMNPEAFKQAILRQYEDK